MAEICNVIEFTIPNEVRYVAEYAFHRNASIKVVNCPSSLTKVGECAFRFCYNLEELNLQSKIECGTHVIDYAKITHFTLSKKVIRKVLCDLPILQQVTITADVTSVEDIPLANIPTLNTVIFEGTTPPTFATSALHFGTTPTDFKIYVPDSAVNTYKAVANLANYKDRIYPISQYTE